MAYNANIEQLAVDIKSLTDTDLQYLVSLLSSDSDMEDDVRESSCMGAMAYAYRTSRAVIAQRDFNLREQAAMDDANYKW